MRRQAAAQEAHYLLSKGMLARRAVAAAMSIALAIFDVCFGSASPEFPDLRGLTRGPAQDLETPVRRQPMGLYSVSTPQSLRLFTPVASVCDAVTRQSS
jgi:hypothetical protein